MIKVILTYLLIGTILILYGPLARKLKEELVRFKKSLEWRLVWDVQTIPKWQKTAYIVTLYMIGLLFYPLLYGILFIDFYHGKKSKTNIDIQQSVPNLCYFYNMGGAGIVYCNDCKTSNKVVSFLHNMDAWSNAGFQCQTCGKFHSIKNVLTQTTDKNCDCSGNLERDKPIFCPKCKSKNVAYQMSYIT